MDALVEVTRRTTVLPDVANLASKADIGELRADFTRLETTTKADLAHFGAASKSDLEQQSVLLKAEIAEFRASTKAEFAELRADIAGAKLQAITVILSGTALIVTLSTVLSKLIH